MGSKKHLLKLREKKSKMKSKTMKAKSKPKKLGKKSFKETALLKKGS